MLPQKKKLLPEGQVSNLAGMEPTPSSPVTKVTGGNLFSSPSSMLQ